jgi:hypothetical protein
MTKGIRYNFDKDELQLIIKKLEVYEEYETGKNQRLADYFKHFKELLTKYSKQKDFGKIQFNTLDTWKRTIDCFARNNDELKMKIKAL